jgi:glycosyltransferase involved in cell wall biosynthesis
MSLRAEDITIAVTVYNRRQFLSQSITSALNQTPPVRVIVVEDCAPPPGLEAYVLCEFGPKVGYFRSPRRRGIFGNWNACIEHCQTRWLSILHDDDYLKPEFVGAMLELNRQCGDRGLYYGQTIVVDDQGKPRPEWEKPPLPEPWLPVTLRDVIFTAPFPFPGQLFQIPLAKELGGFRETSLFCGEWELWSKLIAHYGAAQTSRTLGVFRDHSGWERGTSRIHRSGKTHALTTVQRKRNLALARALGIPISGIQQPEIRPALSARYLLSHARYFSPRYLAYNTRRLQRSHVSNWRYTLFQFAARVGGPRFVRLASQSWTSWAATHLRTCLTRSDEGQC